MNREPEVSAWLAELDHPLIDVIQTVRTTILDADERIAETIKWKSPTFMFKGNLVSIDPKARKHVTLLFHRGAEIPGHHPALEGGGKVARYIRYSDMEAATRGQAALEAIVRAWCDART